MLRLCVLFWLKNLIARFCGESFKQGDNNTAIVDASAISACFGYERPMPMPAPTSGGAPKAEK
ncbi:hypothetical protein BM221_004384 [Beauveria bassiana]|uniref:Uncharacterized protein n=1 Tax=Beauveria bassiana TaxID=176275 RepID=A0A2N6NR35_BEABA|nr:hypothetical protein BM221_004384 [Beauveria bassiana]